jgi:hypothetical protein
VGTPTSGGRVYQPRKQDIQSVLLVMASPSKSTHNTNKGPCFFGWLESGKKYQRWQAIKPKLKYSVANNLSFK